MILLLCTSLLVLPFGLFSQGKEAQEKPLRVVPNIDLNRYAGTWFEIARYPNRFQRECAGRVTATYILDDDGTITVSNRCRRADGSLIEAVGKARRLSDEEPNSKLQVRFAPAILSFLPFVWGDYWVIDLADDYSYAVVGEPNREYLWILARSPEVNPDTYAMILQHVQQQGYDVSKLVRTPQ